MVVKAILVRLEPGTQMQVRIANANGPTTSQYDGVSKMREIPLPNAPENVR